MKKLFAFLAFAISFSLANAQFVYKIKADSLQIHNDSCNAELIIENSTKAVDGFLYNKGNGRTEFRKALKKINDHTYVVGADTLYTGSSGSSSTFSGNNVYYVSKQFAGPGNAKINGLTKDSIYSANPSYTQQLQRAVPGSCVYSFPDPFSARNAALDDISSGLITSAVVIVLSANSYTIGSDDSSKNGNLLYAPNSGQVTDIGFSEQNSTGVASLCQNKISYYFEQGAQLHYLNSAYTIWMSYHKDLSDPDWKSEIKGKGFFKQYYGQSQGFNSGWCLIDNANAQFSFEADYLELQYWQGFFLDNIRSFHININKIQAGYVEIFRTQLIRNGDGQSVQGFFNCNYLEYGPNKIQNSFLNDYWAAFSIGDGSTKVDSSLRDKNLIFRIGNADIRVACPEYDGFFLTKGFSNARITLQIDNLNQISSTVGANSAFASLIGSTFSRNNNVLMHVNIDNATTELPLFGMLKNSHADPARPSQFYFHCGLHRKLPSAVALSDWAKRNINIQNDYLSNMLKAKLVISGIYINECNSEVVAMDYTHMSKLTELKGYYKTTGPGKNVIILNGYQNKRFALVDATLINDGTVPCIALKGSQNGFATLGGIPLNTARTIYAKNVHSNAAPDTNVSVVGDLIKVVQDISEYY